MLTLTVQSLPQSAESCRLLLAAGRSFLLPLGSVAAAADARACPRVCLRARVSAATHSAAAQSLHFLVAQKRARAQFEAAAAGWAAGGEAVNITQHTDVLVSVLLHFFSIMFLILFTLCHLNDSSTVKQYILKTIILIYLISDGIESQKLRERNLKCKSSSAGTERELILQLDEAPVADLENIALSKIPYM